MPPPSFYVEDSPFLTEPDGFTTQQIIIPAAQSFAARFLPTAEDLNDALFAMLATRAVSPIQSVSVLAPLAVMSHDMLRTASDVDTQTPATTGNDSSSNPSVNNLISRFVESAQKAGVNSERILSLLELKMMLRVVLEDVSKGLMPARGFLSNTGGDIAGIAFFIDGGEHLYNDPFPFSYFYPSSNEEIQRAVQRWSVDGSGTSLTIEIDITPEQFLEWLTANPDGIIDDAPNFFSIKKVRSFRDFIHEKGIKMRILIPDEKMLDDKMPEPDERTYRSVFNENGVELVIANDLRPNFHVLGEDKRRAIAARRTRLLARARIKSFSSFEKLAESITISRYREEELADGSWKVWDGTDPVGWLARQGLGMSFIHHLSLLLGKTNVSDREFDFPWNSIAALRGFETRLRPGGSSNEGFLGKEESLEEVLRADRAVLAMYGVSAWEMGKVLFAVTQMSCHMYNSFIIRGTRYAFGHATLHRGYQECPFFEGTRKGYQHIGPADLVVSGDPYEGSSKIFAIYRDDFDPRSSENRYSIVQMNMLHAHLVGVHGLFEGWGTSHRLEPLNVIKFFRMDEGVHVGEVHAYPYDAARRLRSLRGGFQHKASTGNTLPYKSELTFVSDADYSRWSEEWPKASRERRGQIIAEIERTFLDFATRVYHDILSSYSAKEGGQKTVDDYRYLFDELRNSHSRMVDAELLERRILAVMTFIPVETRALWLARYALDPEQGISNIIRGIEEAIK